MLLQDEKLCIFYTVDAHSINKQSPFHRNPACYRGNMHPRKSCLTAEVQISQKEEADQLKKCATSGLGIAMLSALCHNPKVADSDEMTARLPLLVKVSSAPITFALYLSPYSLLGYHILLKLLALYKTA